LHCVREFSVLNAGAIRIFSSSAAGLQSLIDSDYVGNAIYGVQDAHMLRSPVSDAHNPDSNAFRNRH
jgi:hypothetical protein